MYSSYLGPDCVSIGALSCRPATLNWTVVGTDGKNEIFWRDSNTGTVAMWLVAGPNVLLAKNYGAVPSSWSIVGRGSQRGVVFRARPNERAP